MKFKLKKTVPLRILLALAVLCPVSCSKTDKTSREGSVPASEALTTFELEPGFQMELLVSEPMIASPVDMEIDEEGRMYVVEMPGYPLDKSASGRIRLLLDTDRDGTLDKSVVFAENLMFPNGIMRWKKGVIVTDAPNVLYFEDTDQDGKADQCDTLLTGFSLSNPHVNVNNPVYGLDNLIHLSHLGAIGTRKYEKEFGDKGDSIRFPGRKNAPALPPNAGGHNVRFHPDLGILETTSGKSQFGHTFDQWGHHFFTHNQNHIYQEVMAAEYVGRNPDFLIPSASQNISDHGDATEVFQITTNPDRQLFTPVGVTTSSSGLTAYLGGLFPAPFDRAVFVAESVSNLVHVDILEKNGPVFKATRRHKNKEFLASRDSWSRPVNMYVGPDGALYVLDYYRRIIEHPEWMSDEAVAAGGLYDGHDMGRIYRITPKGTPPQSWSKGLKFGSAGAAELVAGLDHPNSWWRTHAQRLLVEKGMKAAVPALHKLLAEGSPAGRLHALWTLEGLGALAKENLQKALTDTTAGIRENAVRLAEKHPEMNLVPEMLKLKNDPDPQVRFQLLCTLGNDTTPAGAGVRKEMLLGNIDNEWIQKAALSARNPDAPGLLRDVLKRKGGDIEKLQGLVTMLSEMVTVENNQGLVNGLVENALRAGRGSRKTDAAILAGIAAGTRRNKAGNKATLVDTAPLLNAFFGPVDDRTKALFEVLQAAGVPDETALAGALARAGSIAENAAAAPEQRGWAIRFLKLGDPSKYAGMLAALSAPSQPAAVQQAAIEVWGRAEGTAVCEKLVTNWEQYGPETRETALAVFMKDDARKAVLLEAIEKGKINPAVLGYYRSVVLMSNPDDKLRNKARKLLTQGENKEKINKTYEQALTLKGTAASGKEVFRQYCAICHQVRQEGGVAFGPDLGTVHNWLPKDLLANILDPALSMAPGYEFWELNLQDGSAVQGLIATESASAVELKIGPGVSKTVSRSEVTSMKSLPISPMPGFGGTLSQQQMADLIEFLRNSHGG